MRQLSIATILQMALYLLGLFGFLFLANAFFGKITTQNGKVTRKFVDTTSQGNLLYRVSILKDSATLDIQAQPSEFKYIEIGDSITYYTRQGLFNKKVIEQYNARVK